MESNLDSVRREPADIHDELLALPPDDFGGRSRLKERQNGLCQLSHLLIEGEPLPDRVALERAYQRLHEVRDRLLDLHLTHVSTSVGDEVEARSREIIDQMRSAQ